MLLINMSMATMLVQPLYRASPVNLQIQGTTIKIRANRIILATHQGTKTSRFGECSSGSISIYITRVAEQSSGLVGEETLTQIKAELFQALEGTFFNIF